jgi:outer membrane protein
LFNKENKMQSNFRFFLKALALCIVASSAAPALAHEAGDLILRAGVANVAPEEQSSYIRPAAVSSRGKAGLDGDTQLGITAVWMFADQWGMELLAATPFTHTISFAGDLAGLGSLAEVKHLPPTVSLQYYFDTGNDAWTPYVGAGINYTLMLESSATANGRAVLDSVGTGGNHSIEADDSVGYALQAGLDLHVSDRMLLNAAVWFIDIDTTVEIANTLKVDVAVDPWVYALNIGLKF